MRHPSVLLQEVLKSQVPCFLKVNMIIKRFQQHIVTLSLEIKQLLSEPDWLLLILFVQDNLLAFPVHPGFHEVDDLV